MTRKDFELIAEVLRVAIVDIKDDTRAKLFREHDGHMALEGAERVARDFSSCLARTNPRFDRERFLKACGVKS